MLSMLKNKVDTRPYWDIALDRYGMKPNGTGEHSLGKPFIIVEQHFSAEGLS